MQEALPGRALIVRPGLIVGPHDPTGRSTYWLRRAARGGVVLAPDRPEAPVQLVDARDLAGWLVARVEARASGVFLATGPQEPLTLGRYLDACRAATGGDARWEWVDEAFLLEQAVQPWTDLPLWVLESQRGIHLADCRRAWRAGLAFRPLADTLRDTLAWDQASPPETRPKKPGVPVPPSITPEREAELLSRWRKRSRAAVSH